jgi:tetratricopeptide (TPR) repeat protein
MHPITQEIGDRNGIASSLNNLGNVYQSQGKYSEAIQSYQKSLAIKREIGDRNGIANSFGNLGNVYQSQEKYSEAIQYHQKSLAIKREIGNRYGIAVSLNNLGAVYQSQGEYSQAIKYYQQAREKFKEINLYHRVSKVDKALNYLREQPSASRLKAPIIGDKPPSKPDWYYHSLPNSQRKRKKSLWQSLVQSIKKWRSRQCRKIKHNFRRKRRY